MDNNLLIKPIIFGFSSYELSKDEVDFFKTHNPIGYILFDRNIKNQKQLASLVSSLKSLHKDREVMILIDEEGGRVSRLKSLEENLFKNPPALFFGNMYKNYQYSYQNIVDKEKRDRYIEQIVYANYANIANKLKKFGINVVCSPVCDLLFNNAHDVIGDRAFSDDPEIVIHLSKIAIKAFMDNDVIPIIKHIPGHGRATVDSHEKLPYVETKLSDLIETDFKIFKNLSSSPLAMTAHIIFSELDKDNPITTSKKAIDFIKKELEYQGFIMSDDLSMKALRGTFSDRAINSLDAGCDILLHCNGNMEEMLEIAENTEFSAHSIKMLSKLFSTI